MKFQLYPHSTLFTSTEEKSLNINEMNIFLSLRYKYSSELPKVYELKQVMSESGNEFQSIKSSTLKR